GQKDDFRGDEDERGLKQLTSIDMSRPGPLTGRFRFSRPIGKSGQFRGSAPRRGPSFRLRLEYQHAGTEDSAWGSRDVEAVALLIPHAGACAERSWEFPHICVVAGVYLLHHAQESFAAGHI